MEENGLDTWQGIFEGIADAQDGFKLLRLPATDATKWVETNFKTMTTRLAILLVEQLLVSKRVDIKWARGVVAKVRIRPRALVSSLTAEILSLIAEGALEQYEETDVIPSKELSPREQLRQARQVVAQKELPHVPAQTFLTGIFNTSSECVTVTQPEPEPKDWASLTSDEINDLKGEDEFDYLEWKEAKRLAEIKARR